MCCNFLKLILVAIYDFVCYCMSFAIFSFFWCHYFLIYRIRWTFFLLLPLVFKIFSFHSYFASLIWIYKFNVYSKAICYYFSFKSDKITKKWPLVCFANWRASLSAIAVFGIIFLNLIGWTRKYLFIHFLGMEKGNVERYFFLL